MLAMTNFWRFEKPPAGDFSGEIIRYSGNFVKMYLWSGAPVTRIFSQRSFRAPPDAGASAGNNDDLVVFSCHDFPPEKVDLIKVYCIARPLSILLSELSHGSRMNKFIAH